MPSLFDSHDEFNEWFSKDIENAAENKEGKLNEHQLRRLHIILKPFMLRRVKRHVQNELSDKACTNYYVLVITDFSADWTRHLLWFESSSACLVSWIKGKYICYWASPESGQLWWCRQCYVPYEPCDAVPQGMRNTTSQYTFDIYIISSRSVTTQNYSNVPMLLPRSPSATLVVLVICYGKATTSNAQTQHVIPLDSLYHHYLHRSLVYWMYLVNIPALVLGNI